VKLFAISDPHLSFGVPGKSMDRFGSVWVNHTSRMQQAWDATVGPRDIVLVPGDISWAKKFEDVLPDLEWLHARPGKKVILKGNHDIWWPSVQLMDQALPSSIRFLQHNSLKLGPFVFFGSRLWDTDEYSVFDLIEWDTKKGAIPGVLSETDKVAQKKLFDRELQRLQLSIDSLHQTGPGIRIGLTHYPPLTHTLAHSRPAQMLKDAGAQHVVFGHLHSVKDSWRGKAFGEWEGVHFHLTSCDYLDMKPKLICEIAA
jgi:uncharacterized protein